MNLVKGFVIIIFIVGTVLLITYFMTSAQISAKCDQKIIYKYIPRTLAEEEMDPVYVSEIFKPMFTQPSVWIDSIYEDDKRKNESLNKYFISQA